MARKNAVVLMLCAIAAFMLSSCTSAPVESAAPQTSDIPEHEEHSWEDGVCTVCGETCEHSWENGRCTVCRLRCAHEIHNAETLECDTCGRAVNHNYEYTNYTDGICSRCGKETMFVWEVGGVDESLKAECAHQGTVETISYTTHAYAAEALFGDEYLIEKSMNVYLPYGYSADEEYNVLYLLHGAGEDEGYWLAMGNYYPELFSKYQATNYIVNILDNMIDLGIIEPIIVVTPTLYSNVEGQEFDQLNLPAHFGKELKNEIMPLIAQRYSTYAKGSSEADLIAARDHQAYAAFSMGSMTGFQSIMTYCTDYISYIGSFSGGYSPDIDSIETNIDHLIESLEGDYKEYPINYWFNGDGTMDNAHDGHVMTYELLVEKLPNRFVDGENCIFFDLPGGGHTYPSWEVDLYNTLLVFFK